jgi:hypothetical protein
MRDAAARKGSCYMDRQHIALAFSPSSFVKLTNLRCDAKGVRNDEAGVATAMQMTRSSDRSSFRPAGASAKPDVRPYGLFHAFHYVPSNYSLAADLKRQQQWEGQVEAIAGPFLPSGSTARCKHETMLKSGRTDDFRLVSVHMLSLIL